MIKYCRQSGVELMFVVSVRLLWKSGLCPKRHDDIYDIYRESRFSHNYERLSSMYAGRKHSAHLDFVLKNNSNNLHV